MKIKVLVYPKDANPYQDLLYSHMDDSVEIRYLGEITKSKTLNNCLIPLEMLYCRINGFRTIHLHWLFSFYLSSTNSILMTLSEAMLSFFLILVKVLKFKLVWTVHNWTPHTRTFVNAENVYKRLASQANYLIVMYSEMKNKLHNSGINKSKISLIHHGNYIEYYKNKNNLKNSSGSLRLLFFGQIKPYKGIIDLILTIKSLSSKQLTLSIVGKCNSQAYTNQIMSCIDGDKRIVFNNNFISKEYVSTIFSNANIVVLPFKKISNSGSAILAFSMGKPIIAPKIGMIKDFPSNSGIYYKPSNKDGLKNAINYSLKNPKALEDMGKQGLEYAKTLDWKSISQKNLQVYKKVLKK